MDYEDIIELLDGELYNDLATGSNADLLEVGQQILEQTTLTNNCLLFSIGVSTSVFVCVLLYKFIKIFM